MAGRIFFNQNPGKKLIITPSRTVCECMSNGQQGFDRVEFVQLLEFFIDIYIRFGYYVFKQVDGILSMGNNCVPLLAYL